MRRRVIALLTDYGLSDPYVGEVKAVIKSVCNFVDIIDITHEVRPFDVEHGAFLLLLSYRFFPKGTIFEAVVDPGVGSARRGLVINSRNYYFVGPDNGLLYPAANEDGILAVYSIDERYYARPYGETFHGRDVFARVAAEIAKGRRPRMHRLKRDELVRLEFRFELEEGLKRASGRVLHVDRFGNLVTSIPQEALRFIPVGAIMRLKIGEARYDARLVKSYAEGRGGELIALFGGTGFLEISVNQCSASKFLSVEQGEEVEIELI
ncbi:MAG: SAM-dependent chlorinase/fluorinase [Aigarchaeota archaeon]|nr:SAM-dependent chlorinase/fluorinase [Aigarchaeota archaeon]MDW8092455.1 SAM-dependent chlorinase/fluorinase [Nitrososphaerota archaeon]